MVIIFLIIVMSAAGFGLVLPAFLFTAKNLGGGPEIATMIVATYSVGQMISTPIWGRMSDRYGRKPILVLSLIGSVISYIGLALATDLWMLGLARAFGGLMAGNFATAMAYVSDVTPEDKRAKGMGIVGAAFSIGFIVGPAMGGLLAGPDAASASLFWPGIAAACIAFLTLIATVLFLKESLSSELRQKVKDQPHQSMWLASKRVFERPVIFRMIMVGLVFVFVTGMFETIFPLWANEKLTWGPQEVGLLFAYLGLIVAIIQGGLIGTLTRRFGEGPLVPVATVLYAIGLVIMAVAPTAGWVIFGITFTAVGSSLFNPVMSSLVSRQAGPQERGTVLGVFQSATWMGRSLGPLLSGVLFGQFGRDVPLLVGAVLMLPCLWIVFAFLRRMQQQQVEAAAD
jgi:DHA1 family tetracycline resistance protein-like MFS transporter